MTIKWIKPWEDKKFYVFDTSDPGNYGVGFSLEAAQKSLLERQVIKDIVLRDFNDLEVFSDMETREYMAGLISRNWKEIEKIREEIRENES